MPHNPNTTATQHTQNQMSETQGILKAGSQLPAASAKVLAWNNPYDNNSNNSYKSDFGTSYQYDLSDPGDRVDYSVDVDAQMRDSISVVFRSACTTGPPRNGFDTPSLRDMKDLAQDMSL